MQQSLVAGSDRRQQLLLDLLARLSLGVQHILRCQFHVRELCLNRMNLRNPSLNGVFRPRPGYLFYSKIALQSSNPGS